jgi:AcrR family transcriptional regulator
MDLVAEKWTPERRRNLTRTALIDAAEEVFAARGYHPASLDEIAERAGFTRGAIYSNFDGKEDLFVAVMQRDCERAIDAFTATVRSSASSSDRSWSSSAELWNEMIAGDNTALCLMLEFRLLAVRNPAMGSRLAAFEQHIERTITELLEQEEANGSIKLSMPASELAVVLYAAGQGLHQHEATCKTDHPDLFRHLLELTLGHG